MNDAQEAKLRKELDGRLDRTIEEVKSRVEYEERTFHRLMGVRLTLEALLRAKAIGPEMEGFVRDWMREGGYSGLSINGEEIVPPRVQ